VNARKKERTIAMLSTKMQKKVRELMNTSTALTEHEGHELSESIIEHVEKCIVPFVEFVPFMDTLTRAHGVKLAEKGKDTLWVHIVTNESKEPNIVFYESNFHTKESAFKSQPMELKKIPGTIDLRKQTLPNLRNG
jgi:hypothetical protein